MVSSKTFDPVNFGSIKTKNRLVMAPMSRNRATPEGNATALMAQYYGQRASAGLIITEGAQPNQVGQGYMNSPGIHTDAQIESWRLVTDAVHQNGGKIVIQLMHAGRIGHPSLYESAHQSVAPSAIAAKGQTFTPDGMQDYAKPREMTRQDIIRTVEDFATAARCAMRAGFDGVEIHSGNGFLQHQFMAENSNRRTDTYGGSITNRVRFAVEVAEAVSAAIGLDRTGMRISPANPYNDISEGDSGALYSMLIRNLPDLAFLEVMEANNRSMTREIRRHWGGALILNPHETVDDWPSGISSIDPVLNENLADAVSLGALFLANPDLINRVPQNGPFNPIDESTFYGGGSEGYTDYSTLPAAG